MCGVFLRVLGCGKCIFKDIVASGLSGKILYILFVLRSANKNAYQTHRVLKIAFAAYENAYENARLRI